MAAAMAACGNEPAEPAADGPQNAVQEARFDDTFELKVGGMANVGGQALTLAFRGVDGDSRCPMDAVCVWMGDALARLDVTVGRMAWTPIELHTHVEPRAARFREFTVELLGLTPYPKSDVTIRPEEYVARLKVTRR
jgi:hypothetical protein